MPEIFRWAAPSFWGWELGFRRKQIQAAVGLLGNSGIRKFLLDLLVHVRGFLRIGLPQDIPQLQQRQRAGNENGALVRKFAESLRGVLGLAGTRINHAYLILRHVAQLFVAA